MINNNTAKYTNETEDNDVYDTDNVNTFVEYRISEFYKLIYYVELSWKVVERFDIEVEKLHS